MEELAKNVITVIIPAYNAAPYLNKCLDSVLNQSYQKLEVIVINDCSSDETAKIAAAIDDPRLRVINLPENHGQSYVRNLGIREAGGEFIAFVDADDFIDEKYYKTLFKKSVSSRADITMAETKLVYLDGRVSKTRNVPKECSSFFNKFALLPHGGACDKLFRTAFLRKNELFFPENYIWEDNLFNLKAVYYANKLATVSGCFYNYIKNSNSTTRSMLKKQKRRNDCVYIVGEMMNFMNENKFRQIEKDLVINFILTHMVTAEVREDPETAAKLEKILGRLEKIKVAKKHMFHFSLRKKQFSFLGKDLWNGSAAKDENNN